MSQKGDDDISTEHYQAEKAVGLIQQDASEIESMAPVKEEEEFTQYGQRWVILLAFSLSVMSLGII